tara:strand:+ start:243605 stop:244513 length:909 start_codon:yes stop_codon:yes gene_type:complete
MVVKYIHISEDETGQRLDNFLLKKLKGVPRSLIYKIIRGGQVRINKGRSKVSYKLSKNDILRIPPITTTENSMGISRKFLDNLEKNIIYDHKDFMVIDKPPKIAVHSGTGLKNDIISSIKSIDKYKNITPVHRLDKNTSGCLILAKNYKAASFFGSIMKKIQKTYKVLLKGKLPEDNIIVEQPLINSRQGGKRKIVVSNPGKISKSTFIKIHEFNYLTLVNVVLDTGRTHQIRVHAANIEHPVCGDRIYGDEDVNKQLLTFGLDRIFLHAEKISFVYDKKYIFESKLPNDLSNVLDNIRDGQ